MSLEEAKENLKRALMQTHDFTEDEALRMMEIIVTASKVMALHSSAPSVRNEVEK